MIIKECGHVRVVIVNLRDNMRRVKMNISRHQFKNTCGIGKRKAIKDLLEEAKDSIDCCLSAISEIEKLKSSQNVCLEGHEIGFRLTKPIRQEITKQYKESLSDYLQELYEEIDLIEEKSDEYF